MTSWQKGDSVFIAETRASGNYVEATVTKVDDGTLSIKYQLGGKSVELDIDALSAHQTLEELAKAQAEFWSGYNEAWEKEIAPAEVFDQD